VAAEWRAGARRFDARLVIATKLTMSPC